jgi:hypothetical protein
MIAALIVLLVVGGFLGLVGLCAGLRAGQCSRRLEESPHLAAPAPLQQDVRRAA